MVAGNALWNVPEFQIAITADLIEHTESTSGNSTTDFTMVNTTGVEFSGQIEEINAKNLEYTYLVQIMKSHLLL